jgi:hypothetical protein
MKWLVRQTWIMFMVVSFIGVLRFLIEGLEKGEKIAAQFRCLWVIAATMAFHEQQLVSVHKPLAMII